MIDKLQHKVFKVISKVASEKNQSVYVIGGFVRDAYLNIESKDIDIVVLGSGTALAREVADALKVKTVAIYENYGTAMLKYGDTEVEFVGARKESYRSDSRNPIVEDGSLEDDQLRRDFTINALALSLNPEDYGSLVDPFEGMHDLENQTIRTPTNPDITFSDDPLRMLRAIRFATRLNFDIAQETFDAITRNASRIEIISKERIIDELNKMILTRKPSTAFVLLDRSGLLPYILPEFSYLKGTETKEGKSHKDNFYHSIEVLDNVAKKSDNLFLRWAAILHDIGKPASKRYHPVSGYTFHGHEVIGHRMTQTIFNRLKLPLDARLKYVQKLVELHLRPIALVEESVTDSAIRRLLFEAGDDIDDLMILCEADITSKNEAKKNKYLSNLEQVRFKLKEIEEKDAVRNFQPPVSGEEIIELFQLKPSRIVGDLKNAVKDAILDGVIKNNYEEAKEFLIKTAKSLGLENNK